MITYVLSNIVTSKVIQRKMNIPRRTINNEAYYIALIEGLGISREYESNGIVVFTNSKLVRNHMKGICQVNKERLKQLHGKENNIVSQLQFFSIKHCVISQIFLEVVRKGKKPEVITNQPSDTESS